MQRAWLSNTIGNQANMELKDFQKKNFCSFEGLFESILSIKFKDLSILITGRSKIIYYRRKIKTKKVN